MPAPVAEVRRQGGAGLSDTLTETAYLLQTFKFQVTLTPVDPAGTSTGLETTGAFLRVQRTAAGGRRQGVPGGRSIRRRHPAGRRGQAGAAGAQTRDVLRQPGDEVADSAIWDWLTAMVTGAEVRRYHGQVQLMDPTFTTALATWTFDRGLPTEGGRTHPECQDR